MAAEAVALVGVASSTITFLEFSIRFYKAIRKIRQSGGELPAEIQSCHRSVASFERMLGRLQRISRPTEGLYGPQTELDCELDDLVDGCRKSGEELLVLLEKMKPKRTRQGDNKLRARDMQTAVRVVRKEGKLRRLEQELRAYKDDLCLVLTERVLDTADSISHFLGWRRADYHEGVSRSSVYEYQVLTRLTRHDQMLNDLRHQMAVSGVPANRMLALLEKLVEKEDGNSTRGSYILLFRGCKCAWILCRAGTK